jgi:hypothetical protein
MDVADYFRLRDAAVLAGGQEFHRFLVSQGSHDARGNEGGLEGVAGGERASVLGLRRPPCCRPRRLGRNSPSEVAAGAVLRGSS